MSELPKGWEETSFGEVVRSVAINDKKLPRKQYATRGTFPVVDQGQEFIGGYSDDAARVVDEDLPLIVFGDHTRIFKFLHRPFVPGADGIKVLKPLGVDEKWLFHIAHALEFPDKGYARHFQHLKKARLLVPPLPEQRRIVARIEEIFSRLDAGAAALRHAKAQLQRYRQSVLAAAVTGSLPGLQPIPPEAWRPISDVIKTLDQGWSPKCESAPAESEDEWAVIRTTAIQAGFFLDYENKKLPSKLEPRDHLELKIGDLLLTRAGPRSRVGVACYVRKVRPKLMLCDKAYRVRLEDKKATPGFIELVLNSPRFVDALDDMKSGISDSGLNLTQKRFAELLIPLPSLAEQHQIVAEVEPRTTAIDHLEAELDRQITRSNRLRQSTLAAAFSGEL